MSANSHIIEMQFEKNKAEYLKVFIYVSLHLLCSQYSVNLRKNTRGLSYFLKQINLHTKTQVNEAMSIYSSLTSTQISKDIRFPRPSNLELKDLAASYYAEMHLG